MQRLLSFVLLALLCQVDLIAQDGDNLFDDGQLHEIHLTMVDSMIFINSKNYQMVNMTFDGVELDSVGFKKKGNISASHPNNKFPFKLKTNKYVNGKEYDGIKEFTLHNNFEDPSMLREKMTYDLMNELGLYSLRTAFAKLYINDIYWGLYTIVEGKDEMYKQVFDNRDGAVLESLDLGDMCYRGPNQEDYIVSGFGPIYVVDNGDEAFAWEKFPPMLEAANNTNASDYMSVVPYFLNVEDFFIYQAANVYLLNHDSYIGFRGNQLYYFDEATGRWEVSPWDFNASFGLWDTNNHRPFDYPILPNKITSGCIAGKIKEVQELEDFYMGTMCNLVNNLADTTRLINLIDQWRNQIETAVYDDYRKDFSNTLFDEATEYGYFTHMWETDVPAMKTFVIDRWNYINQQLTGLAYNCSDITSADNFTEKIELNIYPNPTADILNFSIGGEQSKSSIKRLELYTSTGQIIKVYDNEVLENGYLDISNLGSGFYYLTVFLQDEGFYTKKIIKSN